MAIFLPNKIRQLSKNKNLTHGAGRDFSFREQFDLSLISCENNLAVLL
jgi:hypothetical protein